MKRLRNSFALFAFSLLILGLPTFASAQWRNNRGNNNGGYYGNGNSNRNLQSTIRNLKNRSNQFERRLDRELDHSRYNGKNREDRILQMARDFQHAAERLDDAYDNRNDYSRSQDEARRVIQLGSQLDRAVSRLQINSSVNSDWSRIRQDLQTLANAYNYNNNNNRNNRRNNNNNDWRSAIPFPLPF